ncbi:hypothetical protein F2Q69_00050937 [Brassica cretica]|uniref:Uncharacterized protein n=1 Tax=Brassica cretica TaxID=69181 RepID=A0A8S9Q3M2_BRACR|nr:hypothetical protein F2Q69_00050937 [Brassica cretica]
MDPKLLFCLPQGDALFNPLNTMFIQMACILVFSHLSCSFSFSNHVAGIVLSPALLSRIPKVKQLFLQKDAASFFSFAL